MSERPTILDVARFENTFRFKITKPDQVLAPIMEKWDTEVQSDLIERMCGEIATLISQHSDGPLPTEAQDRLIRLGKTLYRQLFLQGREGDRLQTVLNDEESALLISTEDPVIPWELLHDGDGFLGLKYAIGRQLLKSTGVPIATPWQSDRIRCLLIADPCGDLPAARREAIQLEEWLTRRGINCDLLIGEQANATEVLIRMTSDDYNFIHYSGHVAPDDSDGEYGLVLSEQRLSASELERAISNTGPVVILNGCDTASVEGLADAFIKSGAQLVVGTLFDVSDLGARLWAEAFYTGLLANEQAGESMRKAREITFENPDCASAGLTFVMYGNPCLRLVLGGGLALEDTTLIDHVLETLDLSRRDLDNNCLNILESSLRYAGESGGLSSAHLFTAMLEGPDDRLRDYLQAREVDIDEMRENFERSFRFAELLGKRVFVDRHTGTEVEVTDSVAHILRATCERARAARRPKATFEDLLVVFSKRQKSGVNRLLQSMDIDLTSMVRELGIEGDSKQDILRPLDTVVETEDTPTRRSRSRGASVSHAESVTAAPSPPSAVDTAERYADVHFPAEVEPNHWVQLRVQVLANQLADAAVPLAVAFDPGGDAARVEIAVHAPGFEAMESLQSAIRVPPSGDSEVATFHLRAAQPGPYRIRVDFIQESRYIGTVELQGKVVAGAARTTPAPLHGQPAIGQTGPPPDLTIFITNEALAGGEHRLRFMLLSPLMDLGLYYRDVGEAILRQAPEQWFESIIQEIQGALSDRGDSAERRLRRLGNTLWDELIPDPFKTLFWQIHESIETVLLVSDDPWVPWEVVRPYRDTETGIEEDDFLCLAFSLARWLRGSPTRPHISLQRSVLIGAGDFENEQLVALPGVEDELAAVQAVLEQTGTVVEALDPARENLLGCWETGGFQHLHIASHGNASAAGGNLAVIQLSDGALHPLDISGTALTFGHDHPLVFFNACESGQLGASLTRVGGWAERFAAAGCSAFVGTLWEVADQSALRFAEAFYTGLASGLPIGEACRSARLAIRRNDDPTWLAYCLYGDPQAAVVMAPENGHGDLPIDDVYSPAVLALINDSIQIAFEAGRDFVDSLLFFERLLRVQDGESGRRLAPFNLTATELADSFAQINRQRHTTTPPPDSIEAVGLSKSVSEILGIARILAARAARKQIQDGDVLEAYILQGQSSAMRALRTSELKPESLLNAAFLPDGTLHLNRFAAEVQGILDDMLMYAQRTHLIGSPQIIAALTRQEDSLARRKIHVENGTLDEYVQAKLGRAKVFADWPIPETITRGACSGRAQRILNFAELIARFGAEQISEKHLLQAYMYCCAEP